MPKADLQLSPEQRGVLVAMTAHPGFAVLQLIGESVCAEFDVELKNLDLQDAQYLEKLQRMHVWAKAASQMWAGVISRINGELFAHAHTPNEGDLIPDQTEEIFS